MDLGVLSDDSSNSTDVESVINSGGKFEENKISSSKKISSLYSETSWLKRTNKNAPPIGQKICAQILTKIVQNLGENKNKKRLRSSSISVDDDNENLSKFSKYDQVERELEAMFSDNNDAR